MVPRLLSQQTHSGQFNASTESETTVDVGIKLDNYFGESHKVIMCGISNCGSKQKII